MQLFSRQKPLVGLDIGSSSVKAVELRKVKKGYELVHVAKNLSHRTRLLMVRSWTLFLCRTLFPKSFVGFENQDQEL